MSLDPLIGVKSRRPLGECLSFVAMHHTVEDDAFPHAQRERSFFVVKECADARNLFSGKTHGLWILPAMCDFDPPPRRLAKVAYKRALRGGVLEAKHAGRFENTFKATRKFFIGIDNNTG